MAVVGGETKTMMGRLAELGAWWPFLTALFAVGGTSVMSQLMGGDLPGWMTWPLNLYHGIRDWMLSLAIGTSVNPKLADLAVTGIPVITMLSRRALGFALSIGVFIVLVVGAWFMLRHFGHAAA